MSRSINLCFFIVLALAGCTADQPTPADYPGAAPAPENLHDLPPQVRSFIERKERETFSLATRLGVKPDQATLKYFGHARKGEYRPASRIYQDLRERGGKVDSPKHDPDLLLPLWDPLLEVQLALDAYAAGAGKFATAVGEGIVQSIPAGSIYFGGTDPGRALPAAFSRSSHPFFVLTQNQLADGQHLDYLRAAFGDMLNVISNQDSQQAYQEYLDDAARRNRHDQPAPNETRQLRPGETVNMVDGRPKVSGQVAVMAINGLLTKTLFDKNPDREFYVEESFPLDWMYPHLTPHGLIMKINRKRVDELTSSVVAKDRDFWRRQQISFIGAWLKPETSVREVCEFAERIFLRKDFAGFEGDAEFVRNYYASATYSKLRCSQAGLYAWRVGNSKSPAERELMIREADLAFCQSFAFSPVNIETAFRYVNLLLQTGRTDDALLVARTAGKIDPANGQFAHLVLELERIQKTSAK